MEEYMSTNIIGGGAYKSINATNTEKNMQKGKNTRALIDTLEVLRDSRGSNRLDLHVLCQFVRAFCSICCLLMARSQFPLMSVYSLLYVLRPGEPLRFSPKEAKLPSDSGRGKPVFASLSI